MKFSDIRGHDRQIEILKEHLKYSRLSNGYLFSGPQAIGKKITALALAAAVNCYEGGLEPCGVCASCLKIEKRQHPDVFLFGSEERTGPVQEELYGRISGSEAIKIDDIRQLQRSIALKPYEARSKVFIIDNAHNLTPEASNAVLKVLEEPPIRTLIILVTAKPVLLFKTITSRCKVIKFYSLPRKELKDILCKEYGFAEFHAHYAAYSCGGSIGDALFLKNADILEEKNRIIDLLACKNESGFESLLVKDRRDVRVYLNILAMWFRDAYLLKAGSAQEEMINIDRKDELLKQAAHFSHSGLEAILNCICQALFQLEENVNTTLLLANLQQQIIYHRTAHTHTVGG